MDYYQGYEDAMRQTRVTRGTGLIGFFLRTIVSILYSAFVYVPLLLLSFVLANKLSALYSNDVYIKIGLTIGTAYLLFSFIYFFKGLMIGMKNNGRQFWIVLWILCVFATSGIQVIIAQSMLDDFFQARHIANYAIWSWIGGIVVGILIYSHYQFLTNIAPSVAFWSYRFGFKTSSSTFKNVSAHDNYVPVKSPNFLDNAPMRVSFKK